MVGIRFHINALGAFLKIKRLKVNQMNNMQQRHQLLKKKQEPMQNNQFKNITITLEKTSKSSEPNDQHLTASPSKMFFNSILNHSNFQTIANSPTKVLTNYEVQTQTRH